VDTAAALAELEAFEQQLDRLDRRVQVDVDVDSNRGRQAFDELQNQAATAATGLRGIMSGAFAAISSNVVTTVIAIGVALMTLPIVGALAGAGITLGFVGGLAGIGIGVAAQNKKVQRSFTGLKDHVLRELKQISKPFETTLVGISNFARRTFDRLSPYLADSFSKVAPAITRFADQLGRAFEKLGPAIGPMSDAFVKLLDAIGPQLPGLFQMISDALIDLANTISANPDMFASVVVGLIKLIPWGLQLVGVLANIFVWIKQHPQILQFAMAFLNVAGIIIAAVTSIGPWIQSLLAWFGQLPGKIGSALSSFGSTVWGIVTAAWEWVRSATTTAVGAVVSFVGGLPGKARAALSSLVTFLGGVASSAWNRVRTLTTTGINNVVGFVRGLPGKARAAASALVGNLGTLASQAFSRMRSAASTGVNNVLTLVRGIPGRIRSALGNLGGLLVQAGRNVIQGLINGIRSMIGQVGSAMSSVASTIRSRLPFSPAKEGPLKTHPPDKAGRTIAKMIADGMSVGERLVARAANGLASASLPDVDGQLQAIAGRGRGGLAGGLTVNTYYPQAEPTSRTVNRSLQYAGALGML
jgi:phage-related protein